MTDTLKMIHIDDCCVNCIHSNINCYGQEYELGGTECEFRDGFVAHNNWCEEHEREN